MLFVLLDSSSGCVNACMLCPSFPFFTSFPTPYITLLLYREFIPVCSLCDVTLLDKKNNNRVEGGRGGAKRRREEEREKNDGRGALITDSFKKKGEKDKRKKERKEKYQYKDNILLSVLLSPLFLFLSLILAQAQATK